MSLGETPVATQLPLSDLDQLYLSTLEAVLRKAPWYMADRRASVTSENKLPLPCPFSLDAAKNFFNLRTLDCRGWGYWSNPLPKTGYDWLQVCVNFSVRSCHHGMVRI